MNEIKIEDIKKIFGAMMATDGVKRYILKEYIDVRRGKASKESIEKNLDKDPKTFIFAMNVDTSEWLDKEPINKVHEDCGPIKNGMKQHKVGNNIIEDGSCLFITENDYPNVNKLQFADKDFLKLYVQSENKYYF